MMPGANRILKLLLTLSSLVIAVGVSEIVARLTYPLPSNIGVRQSVFNSELGPTPVPYERGVMSVASISYAYSNNSLGLRGTFDYGAKMKPRILLPGDSFTYGVGVNDDQTFAYLLQKDLSSYEIINAGNPSSGTEFALKFYRVLGKSLRPDIVILCFMENDFMDNQRHWYFDESVRPVPLPFSATHPEFRKLPLRSWFVDHSRLVYLARLVITNYLYEVGLNEPLSERYLTALRDDVGTDNARFLVFYIPASNHLNGSSEESALLRIGNSLGVSVRSLRGLLQPSDYYPNEGHWNAHGHQVAAKLIEESLENR